MGFFGGKGFCGDNCAILFFILVFLLLFDGRFIGIGGFGKDNCGC